MFSLSILRPTCLLAASLLTLAPAVRANLQEERSTYEARWGMPITDHRDFIGNGVQAAVYFAGDRKATAEFCGGRVVSETVAPRAAACGDRKFLSETEVNAILESAKENSSWQSPRNGPRPGPYQFAAFDQDETAGTRPGADGCFYSLTRADRRAYARVYQDAQGRCTDVQVQRTGNLWLWFRAAQAYRDSKRTRAQGELPDAVALIEPSTGFRRYLDGKFDLAIGSPDYLQGVIAKTATCTSSNAWFAGVASTAACGLAIVPMCWRRRRKRTP